MSKYVRYYNDRKNFYKLFAARWAAWAAGVELPVTVVDGMAKFFKPIAKRFGLVQYFTELGIFSHQ